MKILYQINFKPTFFISIKKNSIIKNIITLKRQKVRGVHPTFPESSYQPKKHQTIPQYQFGHKNRTYLFPSKLDSVNKGDILRSAITIVAIISIFFFFFFF